MTGSKKDDSQKPELTLVSRAFLEATARAMMWGKNKYHKHNYLVTGFAQQRLLAAAMRHLVAYNDGEDLDPESGNCHLDHACGALNMLIDLMHKGKAPDDRYHEPVVETSVFEPCMPEEV